MIPGLNYGSNTNLMPASNTPVFGFFKDHKCSKSGRCGTKTRTKVEKVVEKKSGTTGGCKALPSMNPDCSVLNNQVSSLAQREAAQTLGRDDGASVTRCRVPELGLVAPQGFQISFLDFSGLSDCEIKDLKSNLAGEKKCPQTDVPVVNSSARVQPTETQDTKAVVKENHIEEEDMWGEGSNYSPHTFTIKVDSRTKSQKKRDNKRRNAERIKNITSFPVFSPVSSKGPGGFSCKEEDFPEITDPVSSKRAGKEEFPGLLGGIVHQEDKPQMVNMENHTPIISDRVIVHEEEFWGEGTQFNPNTFTIKVDSRTKSQKKRDKKRRNAERIKNISSFHHSPTPVSSKGPGGFILKSEDFPGLIGGGQTDSDSDEDTYGQKHEKLQLQDIPDLYTDQDKIKALANHRNQCYVNSILNFFKQATDIRDPILANRQTNVLCRLIANAWATDNSTEDWVGKVAAEVHEDYNNQDQQDCAEFFDRLAGKLDEEVNIKIFSSVKFYDDYFSCCKYQSETNVEPEYVLKAHLDDSESTENIQDLINKVTGEFLNVRDHCPNCKKEGVMAQQSVMIENYPEILVIQLLRFRHDRITGMFKKIGKAVTCPEEVTYGGKEYELLASIRHLGSTPYEGHYTQMNFGFTDPFITDDFGGKSPEVKPATETDEKRYMAKSYLYFWRKKPQGNTPVKEVVPALQSAPDSKNRVEFENYIQQSKEQRIENPYERIDKYCVPGQDDEIEAYGEPMDIEPLDLTTPIKDNSQTCSERFDQLMQSNPVRRTNILKSDLSSPMKGLNKNFRDTTPGNDTQQFPGLFKTPSRPTSSTNTSTPPSRSGRKSLLANYESQQAEKAQASSISEENDVEMETVINQPLNEVAGNEVVQIFKGSLEDIYFVGERKQRHWVKAELKELFVIIPNVKTLWFRVNSKNAKVTHIKDYIILQLASIFEESFTSPTLSYMGRVLKDEETLDKLGQVILLTNGPTISNHSGKLWSCTSCLDKAKNMSGTTGLTQFKKSHKSCEVFARSVLIDIGKNKWGLNFEQKRCLKPYACPPGHGAPGESNVLPPTPTPKKKTPVKEIQSPRRRVRKRLDLDEIKEKSDSEDETPKPTGSKSIESDSSDDNDDQQSEESYKNDTSSDESQDDSDQKPKVEKSMTIADDKPAKPLSFEYPTKFEDTLGQAREDRVERMRQRIEEQSKQVGTWKPDENDMEEWKLLRKDIIEKSKKTAAGRYKMSAKSRQEIKEGKIPEDKEDRLFIPKTVDNYFLGFKKLFNMLSKKHKKVIRVRHLFAYMEKDYLPAENIIPMLDELEPSATNRMWAYCVYIKLLVKQIDRMPDYQERFKVLIDDPETMHPEKLKKALKREVLELQNETQGVLNRMSNAKYHSTIDNDRVAEQAFNDENKDKFDSEGLPEPEIAISNYFNDERVRKMDLRIAEAAEKDLVVSDIELSNMSNHILVCLSLKGGHRKQVPCQLTRREYLTGIQKSKPCQFPWFLDTKGDDIQGEKRVRMDGEHNYVYNEDAPRPDNVPEELSEAVSGIILEVHAHKTSKNSGPALIWLSQADQIRMECYHAIVLNLAENKGLEYPIKGPFFVTSEMTPWAGKDNKRPIDFSLFSKIAGISYFRSHLCRKLFSTYCSSSGNLLLREGAAMAANHSIATQQKQYITAKMRTLQAISANIYYQQNTAGVETCTTGGNIHISDKHSQRLEKGFQELNAMERNKLFSNLQARDKNVPVTYDRLISQECKVQLISLIIKASEMNLAALWKIDYPSIFLTKTSVRNRKCRALILMLLDYGLHLKLEIAEDLFLNLLQLCDIFAPDLGRFNMDEIIELAELEWTRKLVEVFHNLQDEKKTLVISNERMKHYLAEYNKDKDYKFTFGNDNIADNLKMYAEKKLVDTSDKTKSKTGPKDGLEELRRKSEAIIKAGNKKKELEHYDRLKSQEELANQGNLSSDDEFSNKNLGKKRSIVSSDEDDSSLKPQPKKQFSTKSKMTFTPSKSRNETLVISTGDGEHIEYPIGDGITIEHRIEDLPDIEYPTPKKKIQGQWTDEIKLQLLIHWVTFSNKPFYFNRTSNKKEALIKLEHFVNKLRVGKNGKPLKSLTTNTNTLWEKLTKGPLGFSWDKKTPLMQYLDNAMYDKFGDDTRNWTHAMAINCLPVLSEELTELIMKHNQSDYEDSS